MAFSEKDEILVKESWDVIKQNIPQHSLRFFMSIAQRLPGSRYMFTFLKESDEMPLNNPRLRAHAVKVLKLMGESACQLREKGDLIVPQDYLKHMGSVHLQKGITDYHFQGVKEALLMTIKEAMGEKWSEDMNNAWAKAYDHLASAIKANMSTT